MKKPPLPRKSESTGLPMRWQIIALIMGFIIVVSAVSFSTSYRFILRDKESSLRDLQLLKIEQIRSRLESRIETVKGLVLESALRLLDATRAKPDLNVDEWQYLIADTARWVGPNVAAENVPAQAVSGAGLLIEISTDKNWITWTQELEISSGGQQKRVPVQAKFRSSLIFKSIEEFREGGLDVVLVQRLGPQSYDLIWGNPNGLEKLKKVDQVDPTLFAQATAVASKEVTMGTDTAYVSWGAAPSTSWLVVSAVDRSTLIAGLSYLFANQGFWILVVVLLAVFVSFWFARRFSRPIETLVKASQNLETGDFSTRVDPDGPAELRSLGSAFNSMGQGLEDREAALKSAQDALIQNEKLAALGTLSAGIAHEVKNPLAGILGNADLLSSSLTSSGVGAKALQYVEIIQKETRRCREIIDSLMRFSRQESTTSEKTEVDLELAAWDAINLVEHSLNMQGFQIRKEFSDEMPVVLGVSNQIQQVLLNMMQNAGHAMESSSGKTLTVGLESFDSLEMAPPGAFVARDASALSSGKIARIWIRDEGTGMSPEVQRRIFEPFFTTKEAGKGTGLGLAVTMGILADHEVRLSIDSEVGAGTTFYMDFLAVGPRSVSIQEKLDHMRQKAKGGQQSDFDVGSSSVDVALSGDDKPIALFDEPMLVSADKTATGFSVRKPKMKKD